mmetsp:Transcript_3311/g.7067  ORF Transcript_3311/g.7067 Transcript_3311/m.7067 type:complete len:260 (-) Transcript_3311:481-1260(-)
MSRPREATSVATRTVASPRLNSRSTACRSACVLSPWMAATGFDARLESAAANSSADALVEAKTSTVPCFTKWSRRRSSHSSLYGASGSTSTTCVTSSLASPALPTTTRTGSASASRARRSKLARKVAEKSSVWRSGRTWPSSERTCGSKPIENIRSASSRTTKVTRSVRMPPFIRTSSSSLPGVPTATSAPLLSSRNCSCLLTPPYAPMQRSPWVRESLRACTTICSASSCVGATTSAIGPSPLRSSGWSITWVMRGSR